ncbi:MAG: hypothetical protein Q8P18_04590 [Pseudomonadota bacterium]|nr:hypothetical protein [Pseudomonadota bacterium]
MMLLLVLLACAPPPLPVVDEAPSIHITWPLPEADVTGCETVAVTVENFDLVEFPSTDENAEGEGHYHILSPRGYDPCYKPYCFVDLTDVVSTTEPYFTAVLTYTDHTEVLIDGARIEHQIPINFIPGGDCATAVEDTGGGY